MSELITVKALADTYMLDVLGNPYGGPGNLDAQGEYFSAATRYHEDKYPLPPAVYYHGYTPEGKPAGVPEYIGRTVKRWADEAGVWYRVVLDKANAFAQRVWEAAKQGAARASTGSAAHLVRVAADGHIQEWPTVELSLFDTSPERQPANRYAVAIPVTKSIYQRAGLPWPEAGAQEAGDASLQAAASGAAQQTNTKGKTMDAQEIQKIVADAMKAQKDAERAEADAKAAKDAEIAAAVKAALEAKEKEDAAKRRLPGGIEAPHVAQYGYTRRYDNLTPGEHAFVVAVAQSAAASGLKGARRPSDDCVRALALKCESKDNVALPGVAEAALAIKALPIKANEIMESTLASYGDEWIGVLYSANLWEAIRAECWVLNRLQPFSDQIPDGYESDVVPLESTDPTWYKVAQSNTATTNGQPDVTVTASKFATAQKAVSLAKMGCRVMFSGELTEDSLVRIAPQAVRQIQQSGMEQFEHVLIDGDTTTTTLQNINDVAGTPAGTEVFLLVDGFRKLGLVTNAANSRSAGALTEDDYLETAKLLGTAGINADVTKCSFIIDMNTYWKSLQLAALKTRDVFTQATLENGQLARIWGYEVKPSAFMHYMQASRKAQIDGYVDQDNAGDNVTGSILCVRWDQWRMKWKRRMTLETSRWPEADTNQIVAMVRWGLGYRDTEAAAISYNVTL